MDAASEMTTSARIRALGLKGMETAEIARQLGIRYQHVYKILKASGASSATTTRDKRITSPRSPKPPLRLSVLTDGGFLPAGRWIASVTNELIAENPLPKDVGVYAFVKDGVALYVGVATIGIAKRLYFYGRPGASQRTSQRLNALIKNELSAAGASIEIYVAIPPDLQWNGLPVHGSAGLELGLIKKYALPWNMRSAG